MAPVFIEVEHCRLPIYLTDGINVRVCRYKFWIPIKKDPAEQLTAERMYYEIYRFCFETYNSTYISFCY